MENNSLGVASSSIEAHKTLVEKSEETFRKVQV
jgi:hypothetical protein